MLRDAKKYKTLVTNVYERYFFYLRHKSKRRAKLIQRDSFY